MNSRPSVPSLAFLVSWALLPAGAAAAPAGGSIDPAALPGLLYSTALTNLAIALAAGVLLVAGLYAYASLARFAPYHSWIYLYLVSFTGVVWAFFLLDSTGSPVNSVFILTSIAGINLIVHVLRFDRIEMPHLGSSRAGIHIG